MSIEIREPHTNRRGLAAIVQWDVHRIILAHGNVVEHDAARAFHEACTWL